MVKLQGLECKKVICVEMVVFFSESMSSDVGRSGEVPGVVGTVRVIKIIRVSMTCLMSNDFDHLLG